VGYTVLANDARPREVDRCLTLEPTPVPSIPARPAGPEALPFRPGHTISLEES